MIFHEEEKLSAFCEVKVYKSDATRLYAIVHRFHAGQHVEPVALASMMSGVN